MTAKVKAEGMLVKNNRGVFQIVETEQGLFRTKETGRELYESLPLLAKWADINNKHIVLEHDRLLGRDFLELSKKYTGGLAQGRLDAEHRCNYDELSESFLNAVNETNDGRIALLLYHLSDTINDKLADDSVKRFVMEQVLQKIADINDNITDTAGDTKESSYDQELQDVVNTESLKSSSKIISIIMGE